ncbi:MAG: hypothetical protein JNL01_00430 [Bdellovibrionales bacterium]|nr:hypothetical protein [Bdellovibrionales bacterium]
MKSTVILLLGLFSTYVAWAAGTCVSTGANPCVAYDAARGCRVLAGPSNACCVTVGATRRKVLNSTGNSIFVPMDTNAEFTNMIGAPPASVTFTNDVWCP